jgi:3-deoxy-D-manno-octulosonate 8-phosphate phosphatase (KDO 8-P phosphatase)
MTISFFSIVKLVAFDFDGVFTDNSVYVGQDGTESVKCCRSDGLGLTRLSELGIKMIIISTEKNPVVSIRADKLNIPVIQAVGNKAEVLSIYCEKMKVSLNETIFVGNDINDIPAFKIVGMPIAVADSYPEILPYTQYTTKKQGGKGAVREVCDLIYDVRRKNYED